MQFESMAALATYLAGMGGFLKTVEHSALENAAILVEKTAKEEIGVQQPAWGPFEAWQPLADSTEAQKAQKGYPADAPLLATGDLQKSIGHQVDGNTAIIGSTDPVMVFHEFGTEKMPPRPVLGPALFRNKEAIVELIGEGVVEGIVAGRIVGGERFKA